MSQPAIGEDCWRCKHIRADYTCEAFQGFVPADIANGVPHTFPFPGDRGIRFEARAADEESPEFISLMPKEHPPEVTEYLPEMGELFDEEGQTNGDLPPS